MTLSEAVLRSSDKKISTTETSSFNKQGDGSVLHLKSKEEDLHGHVDAGAFVLDVEQFNGANELLSQSGRFEQFQVSDQLVAKTEQHAVLDKVTQRECGVDLTAVFSTTSSHAIVDHLIANGNLITHS